MAVVRVARCLLVLGVLVASACASTGREDMERARGRRAPGTTTTTLSAGSSTTSVASPDAGVANAPSAAGRPAATAPPARDAGRGAAARPTRNFGPVGQGVRRTEIEIGFWYMNSDATCAAVGAVQGCDDDNRAEIEAVVRYVNSRGGIAGRKVNARIYGTNTASASYSAQAQAACTFFTEDQKVFAVVSENQLGRPHMPYCLARKGVPVVDPGYWPLDNLDYRNLRGFLYQPTMPRPERWVASYIDELWDQGFFAKDSRIGLIRYDGAGFTRVTNGVLKRRLAAHGLRLTEEAVVNTPPAAAAYGQLSSQLSNVVLRFRTARVNRVLFFETLGELAFFYFPQAEAQGYRPRYGVSSMDWLSFMAESVPKAQLRGAVGIGWSPHHDVFAADDPGGGPATAACKRILREAGLNAEAGRNPKCDATLFLKAALDRAPAVNVAGLRAAVEAIGQSYDPVSTFAVRFGPGRYDGPAAIRRVAFNEGCGCFRYTSGLRPLAD